MGDCSCNSFKRGWVNGSVSMDEHGCSLSWHVVIPEMVQGNFKTRGIGVGFSPHLYFSVLSSEHTCMHPMYGPYFSQEGLEREAFCISLFSITITKCLRLGRKEVY